MLLKGFVAAVIIGLSLQVTSVVFAQSDLTMTLDGQVINSDVPPFIENDRTMVPVRFISEAFGAEVDWDEDARLVTISKDLGVEIQLTIGSNVMRSVYNMRDEYVIWYDVMNENPARFGWFPPLDVAAVIRDDRTFVPVRSIAEALGILTSWDDESRTVIFTTLDYMGWVYDDFPDGYVYIEHLHFTDFRFPFTGDYGDGLSPREAALRTLSAHRLRSSQRAEGYDAQPNPMHIILVHASSWGGTSIYSFIYSAEIIVPSYSSGSGELPLIATFRQFAIDGLFWHGNSDFIVTSDGVIKETARGARPHTRFLFADVIQN